MNLGSKVTISRGWKGQRPDFYPGVIVSEPKIERVNGRLIRTADVITAQPTQAGELRLAKRIEDLAFAFDARRPGAENVPLLDGPTHAPRTVQEIVKAQAIAAMEYLESRPATVAAMDLADVALDTAGA
jgi:hypothetical protein